MKKIKNQITSMMGKLQHQLIGLLAIVFIFSSCGTSDLDAYTLEKTDFVQTITETGELAAVNVKSFVLPRYGRYWYEMKIIGLLDHGNSVAAGDSVIQLDPSQIKKFIIDKENELETQKANLEKIIVEIENRKSDLNSSLRSEQAAFDLKRLELDMSQFESDKAKKIKELEFEQAKIRLNKVKKSVEFYKTISSNQFRIQQINVQRRQEEIKNAYEVLPKLTIRTPIPGIFQVAKKRRSRDLIQIGDDVYVGNNLGNVPDLTWMKVNTVVNEADFMKIKSGQQVNVRLDALPDVIFKGEISSISKLCRTIDNDSRQKIFDVVVKIKESDERLKPGMTVSCEYVCSKLDDVFSVPVAYVEFIDGKGYVNIKKGNSNKREEVKIGPMNNSSVVISGDIKKGQHLLPIEKTDQTIND